MKERTSVTKTLIHIVSGFIGRSNFGLYGKNFKCHAVKIFTNQWKQMYGGMTNLPNQQKSILQVTMSLFKQK